MLSDTDMSVERIARHLGYNEPNSFRRAFRQWDRHVSGGPIAATIGCHEGRAALSVGLALDRDLSRNLKRGKDRVDPIVGLRAATCFSRACRLTHSVRRGRVQRPLSRLSV